MYEQTNERFRLCPRDGTPVFGKERFCPACGTRVSSRYIPAWSWWTGILLLTILFTYGLASLNQDVYATFQQDSCTLTARWQMQYLGYGTYMFAGGDPLSVTYRVTNAQHQMVLQGSGALGLKPDSSAYPSPENGGPTYYDQSQTSISTTTPCWYSPYALPKVIWNQPGESNWWALWFCGTGVIAILVYLCVLRLLIYPWQLVRRGVRTTGTVTGCEIRHTRNGYYYVSFVRFKTRTTPSIIDEVKTRGKASISSEADVWYDYLNPLKNRKVAYIFDASNARRATFGGIALLLLLLSAQALVVLSALNF